MTEFRGYEAKDERWHLANRPRAGEIAALRSHTDRPLSQQSGVDLSRVPACGVRIRRLAKS